MMVGNFRLAAGAALSFAAGNALAQDITIGIPGPITGPVAFLGQHMRWGADLAAEQINAKGGVMGRKIKIVMQDSVCRPADAVSATERLIGEDKAALLLGDICSGATLAMMPIVERAPRPMIVSISTHPDVTAKAGVGGNPWVFRSVANDTMITDVIARQISGSGLKTISFLAEDTDYGRSGVALVKVRMGEAVKVVSEDYVKNSDTDFLQVLTRLRSAKPDALCVFMLDQQGLNLMKQYTQFGLATPIVGRPPLVSPLVSDLLATGKFNNSWTVYPYYDAYDTPKNRAFVEPFVKLHNQPPHYVAYGVYEAIQIAANAIARAGGTEPEKLRDALKATHYDGILGPVEFDENDQAHNNLMFLQVQDGKLRVKDVVKG